MKQLSVIFILICFACNSKTRETTKTKVAEVPTETKKEVKKTPTDITKDFVLGKFDYRKDSTFVKVASKHSAKEIYLKSKVYDAFLQMSDSANKVGITLKIISGTRNFHEQKAIWERKWNKYSDLKPIERALKILEYSSMPSSSRHHWGTDVDLNSLNNSYFNIGKGLEVYNWLTVHANAFGFYQVYTNKKNGRTGYNLEKWHWSYLPLASQYLEFFNLNIGTEDINGFEGSKLAVEINIIKDYVNGISEEAKNYK
ncbi:M15 family metallopeptidase [Winogradskyella luteola]|uniref:M15 family metallopeptidase n=1 Tax=Winogradskyella luteola TaxID=2828330 RepID=A0A9X1F818_9FLAO|nr:M15 family metallopeptidase [Winogradskyella luteola]MBV7267665.1 M15 family metallopeptidase [Winogradskyella luteola]